MSDLKRIVKMAELLTKQQHEVERAEAALKAAKAALYRLEREDLPTLMEELGLKEIRLEDGSVIEIKKEVDAKITKENRLAALRWLMDNGYGGLIKTNVAIAFNRGDHDTAVEVRNQLAQTYSGVELEENVHHSTLKAFVKERLTAGDKIPFDLFGIHPYNKAILKR